MANIPRRVAILGGTRIPFARANGAYMEAGNQQMLTAAMNALVEKFRSEKRKAGRGRGRRGDQALARLEPGARIHARQRPASRPRRPTTCSAPAAPASRRWRSSPTASRSARSTARSPAAPTARATSRSPTARSCSAPCLSMAQGQVVVRQALAPWAPAPVGPRARRARHRRAAHRPVDGPALRGDGEGMADRPPRAGRARARQPQERRGGVAGGFFRRPGHCRSRI